MFSLLAVWCCRLHPSLLLAPLNFKSAFSLQRIFRCQIFPCEDWQFGVLVFAVLFAWEMAWDSPIVNIVLQTMKTQLFMSALVIIAFSRMLPRNKNAPWRQLLYDVMADTIGYIQVTMKTATLQLARTHARFTHCTRLTRDKIINSLRSALRASLCEELQYHRHRTAE